MIQQGTYLKVIDNSFIGEISCIRVKKKGRRPQGLQGDFILGSVRSLRKLKTSILQSQKHLLNKGKKKTWKGGDLVRAFVVRSRKSVDRSRGLGRKAKNQTGIRLSFPHENAAILVSNDGKEPLGTRIPGPITPTARGKGLSKILVLGGQSML